MSKEFDLIVYIGRFQPVHSVHLSILRRAADLSHRVLTIVSSADKPRTYKDPWSAPERIQMIRDAIAPFKDAAEFLFATNTDTIYNNAAWASRVQAIVQEHGSPGWRIGIIGSKKDKASAEVLDMFPQWKQIEIPTNDALHATDIRDLYFRREMNLHYLEGVLSTQTINNLRRFSLSPSYQDILAEKEFLIEHNKQFANLRYPPIFVTVDALVMQSGHILLIKRRAVPGKGLWALPGGYVNAKTDYSIRDAMVRELREETGLKVPEPVLIGNIRDVSVFDHPNRSPRGRIITHVHKIVLPAGPLPKVKGADDAEKAMWVPVANLESSNMFEDHYEIIQVMAGI